MDDLRTGEAKVLSLPLDDTLYSPDSNTVEFLIAQTGIEEEEELKRHILSVQAAAYEVYPYTCIRQFLFLDLRLSKLPAYDHLLTLGKERPGAIFLDVACCFGNDIRKAVYDGYPIGNCIGTDLRAAFWDIGHEFFKSTPETFPVPFIQGDIFDPAHLEAAPPFETPPTEPPPQLSALTSLNPLRGRVSVIHASAFFHLFDEEGQLRLARALAGLLSPVPGSMILGWHVGRPEKGFRYEVMPHRQGIPMFCHNAASWRELWDGVVFAEGMVRVDVVLQETMRPDWHKVPGVAPGTRFYALVWSVTRL
ncbi:hypothetical protein C8Q77DRAFT_1204572 [Trametes polyzona]|nr:hypothetical protein C8Q77DRAFT_1204572 [Trametes polyzona]